MGNFVQDQQSAVPIASGPDLLPVLFGRNKRRAADRFGNDCGDVPLFLQDILDILGATQVADSTALKWTMPRVSRRDVFAAWQQRPALAAEDGFASHRDGVQ